MTRSSPISTPSVLRSPISFSKAAGSITIPLPMTHRIARVQDAGRDQVEDEALVLDDHGVPGVVARRCNGPRPGPLEQQVDDLALALVAPLGADDDDVRHGESTAGPR